VTRSGPATGPSNPPAYAGGPSPHGSRARKAGSHRFNDQEFLAINGGPRFRFTEAISLFVACDDRAEVDYLWGRLSEGGEAGQCGWLKDRFGLSWQIIPRRLMELIGDPDPARASPVREAMLLMEKIDVDALEAAHAGRSRSR